MKLLQIFLWYRLTLECFFFVCYLQLFLLAFVRSGFGMEDQSQIFKLPYGKGKSVYDITHWFMHLTTSTFRNASELCLLNLVLRRFNT